MEWLEKNSLAEKEEFEAKQKEVEAIANPIMTKIYQAAGAGTGAGGMPDMGAGGFPGAGSPDMGDMGAGGAGPSVEEVD